MMLPPKVRRSTIAAWSLGSVKVLVQPLKLSLLAMVRESWRSSAASTSSLTSLAATRSGLCGRLGGGGPQADQQVALAITKIRRLVDGLRPPALTSSAWCWAQVVLLDASPRAGSECEPLASAITDDEVPRRVERKGGAFPVFDRGVRGWKVDAEASHSWSAMRAGPRVRSVAAAVIQGLACRSGCPPCPVRARVLPGPSRAW